ncbi:MAG: FmdB family zinc ribbon protein [Candidatus Nanopelagicales bacterium]
MPTYEYMCTACGAPLEVVQSIHEPSLTDCPACPDGRLRKVFGNVGVVFKGSGFYRTDSRSKSSATAPSGSKAEVKGSAKGSSGSGDSTASSTSSGGGSTSAAGSGSSSSGAKSPAKT